MSRANGAYLVVDHFLRGLRSIKKKKKTDIGRDRLDLLDRDNIGCLPQPKTHNPKH